MKIIVVIIYIFISQFNIPYVHVLAESQYARAEKSTNLYKLTNSQELSDVICLVEKSYFVEIISEFNEYLKVNYNGLTGFVKKDEVISVNEIPTTPFPYNIKIKIGNSCNFRSSPTIKSTTNNIISTINSGETNIEFLGRVFAEEAIDFGGTTWYLVRFNGEIGYIYNKYVEYISPIYENTEHTTPLVPAVNQTVNPFSKTSNIIILILLLIPSIIIIIILYLPRKLNIKTKKHKVYDKY